jgi:very-short-patch-repair endonuclease
MRHPGAQALGADSAGAVEIGQCRAAGLSDEQVKWLVESGRWQSAFRGTYVAYSGPVNADTRQHAALLYGGEGAALSHESAGFLWRLCGSPSAVHLCVPYHRVVDPQPGLVVHRSRTLTDADVHPVFRPRRTRIERTVLDLLCGERSAEAALGPVADAIRDRATTPDRLREALRSRSRTRWRRVVLDALPDIRAGVQSVLELRDAALRRQHGLPMGSRQVMRRQDGTEHLDVVVEEHRLHVELDGRLGHDRAREILRDMKRDNRSEVAGLRHLRYGWSDIVDRPCQVALEQALVLSEEGWRGAFRRCPSCPDPQPPGL